MEEIIRQYGVKIMYFVSLVLVLLISQSFKRGKNSFRTMSNSRRWKWEGKIWKCKECGGKIKFERHYKDSLNENEFIIEEESEAEEFYKCQDCGEENYLIQLITDWKE